jgi:NAD(P)-dependent dehydrogenase (short-subunit alcohol dehydrogenase family)
MGLLDGKVIIITGAGRGIGRAEALELSRVGATVILGDVDGSVISEVAELISRAGGAAAVEAGDCSEEETADRLVSRAIEEFGRLDGLVNNAGILRDRTLVNMTAQEWDDVIRVNLRSHYVMTHAAFAYWYSAGVPGHVVCTSSTSGLLGGFGQCNYGAAKAGVAAFSGIAAQEGRRYNITVNAICPAARTRLSEGAFGLIPVKEEAFDFWNVDNVAPLVAFLCSDASSHISGKVFGVQGDAIEVYHPWTSVAVMTNRGSRWSAADLGASLGALLQQHGIAVGPEDSMARLRYSMRAGDLSWLDPAGRNADHRVAVANVGRAPLTDRASPRCRDRIWQQGSDTVRRY